MAPDLPYVRQDVPDDSEAPQVGGRFARLTRSGELLARSPASKGITAYLSAAHASGMRAARIVAAVAIASALTLTLLGPQAAADELVAHRARVKQQITKTKSDLNESTEALSKAAIAVDKAQNKLDAASARLAATRQELTTAQVKDAQMEGRLRQARSDLAAAVAAVAAGQARLNVEQAKAGQLIRDQYQQQTNLLPVAVLVDPHSTEDWQTRLQWSTTLFDTTQAQIDRLTVLQRQLNAARVRQADLEAKVAAARREAAANLKIKRSLEARATAEEATVAQLVHQRKTAEEAAATDVAHDKARYSQLIKERASVERRIASRIAKAAAAREACGPAEGECGATVTLDRQAVTPLLASTLNHAACRPRLLVPCGSSYHVTVRHALPSGAALLEAARRYRLRRLVWHADSRCLLRSGRRAVLQRRLRKQADDRPRLHQRQVCDNRLQSRESLHRARRPARP